MEGRPEKEVARSRQHGECAEGEQRTDPAASGAADDDAEAADAVEVDRCSDCTSAAAAHARLSGLDDGDDGAPRRVPAEKVAVPSAMSRSVCRLPSSGVAGEPRTAGVGQAVLG